MSQWIQFFSGNDYFFVINVLLQSTVVVGTALLATRLFRFGPALRYAIVYRSLLCLPLLAALSLGLQLGDRRLILLPVETGSGMTDNAETAVNFWIQPPAASNPANQFSSRQQAAAREQTQPIRPDNSNFLNWLFLIWLGGAGWSVRSLLSSYRAQRRLIESTRAATAIERLKVKRSLANYLPEQKFPGYSLRISKVAMSPVIAGFRKPALLLPEKLLGNLSDEELGAVLLHEMAHLQRGDVKANLIQKLVLTLFWFHPLIRLADRRIARAREEICDNYVLACTTASRYSEVLFKINQLLTSSAVKPTHANKPGLAFSQVAMSISDSSWHLEHRIGDLLSNRRNTAMTLTNKTDRSILAVLSSAVLIVAACQVGAAQPADNPAVPVPAQAALPSLPVVEPPAPVKEPASVQDDKAEIPANETRRQLREAIRVELEEVALDREELRQTRDEARLQIQDELESIDLRESIDEARSQIRDQLENLNDRLASDPDQANISSLEQAVAGLDAALRGLEDIDIDGLQRTIQRTLETELRGFENLDLEFDFEEETDEMPDSPEPGSTDAPA